MMTKRSWTLSASFAACKRFSQANRLSGVPRFAGSLRLTDSGRPMSLLRLRSERDTPQLTHRLGGPARQHGRRHHLRAA